MERGRERRRRRGGRTWDELDGARKGAGMAGKEESAEERGGGVRSKKEEERGGARRSALTEGAKEEHALCLLLRKRARGTPAFRFRVRAAAASVRSSS